MRIAFDCFIKEIKAFGFTLIIKVPVSSIVGHVIKTTKQRRAFIKHNFCLKLNYAEFNC